MLRRNQADGWMEGVKQLVGLGRGREAAAWAPEEVTSSRFLHRAEKSIASLSLAPWPHQGEVPSVLQDLGAPV